MDRHSGPSGIATLVRFAARCGVSASSAALAKYGISVGKFLGSAGPDKLVEALNHAFGPQHGPVRLRFYPFGGPCRTVDWIHAYDRAHPRAYRKGRPEVNNTYLLRIEAADRPGLVARVAGFIADRDGNIIDAQQFDDRVNDRFFMRVAFQMGEEVTLDRFRQAFAPLANQLALTWSVRDQLQRRKVLLMVSKWDHCLGDLLYRHRIGELPMDVVGVASNHSCDALPGSFTEGIPFHYLPVTTKTRTAQEQQIKHLVVETGAELVVLARYMQILSDDLASYLSGRCINIHHSFLPGFKGARPYHQAHARGVKMIGATAHYVTSDLDEGPIIHQDVEAISHSDTPDELIRKGRDIERRVLAEAVRLHLDGRVFLNGTRTVVFKG